MASFGDFVSQLFPTAPISFFLFHEEWNPLQISKQTLAFITIWQLLKKDSLQLLAVWGILN